MTEEPRVEIGQLRRWLRPDHERDIHKPFVILGEEWDRSTTEACWRYLMDGKEDWNFEEVILDDSELLSEAR